MCCQGFRPWKDRALAGIHANHPSGYYTLAKNLQTNFCVTAGSCLNLPKVLAICLSALCLGGPAPSHKCPFLCGWNPSPHAPPPTPALPGAYMQPGARENIAYLTHTERRKDFQYEAMQERREAENMAQRGIGVAASSVPMNFKDLIETKAEEHNIVFMPVIGKRHEGKQLYTFGRIVIYIDRGVVFVQGEKTWVPTSLQSLIDMAK